MATAACKGAAKRLLKCFCGCTELTVEEVQRIYRLNTQATLIDRPALKLLRSFLEQRRSGDKSETQQFLEIYEASGNYMLAAEDRVLTLDELDELSDLGLSFHLETELKNAIKTGDRFNIQRCLQRIQGEYRNDIEASDDFKDYKQAILDKLKRV